MVGSRLQYANSVNCCMPAFGYLSFDADVLPVIELDLGLARCLSNGTLDPLSKAIELGRYRRL